MTPRTDTALPSLDQLHTPGPVATQRLRNVLRLNAATSLLGGIAAVAVPFTLDRLLGTGQTGWIRIVGLGLAIYAVDLLILAGGRVRTLHRWVPLVVGADAAWVAATGFGVAAGWFSPPGTAAMVATAGAVGTFAVLQSRHHRAMGPVPDRDPVPPVEIASVSAAVPYDPAVVWQVLTDHELYGTLAANLGAVRATAPNGPGLARTCSNRRGQEWHEQCTLWNEGERFEVAVDTSDYPYPLQVVRGAWWLRPAADGSTTVGMQFAFQPTRTVRGRAFAIVMQAAFPLVLRRILRGWRRAAAALAAGS
jgi:hypothetical protein